MTKTQKMPVGFSDLALLTAVKNHPDLLRLARSGKPEDHTRLAAWIRGEWQPDNPPEIVRIAVVNRVSQARKEEAVAEYLAGVIGRKPPQFPGWWRSLVRNYGDGGRFDFIASAQAQCAEGKPGWITNGKWMLKVKPKDRKIVLAEKWLDVYDNTGPNDKTLRLYTDRGRIMDDALFAQIEEPAHTSAYAECPEMTSGHPAEVNSEYQSYWQTSIVARFDHEETTYRLDWRWWRFFRSYYPNAKWLVMRPDRPVAVRIDSPEGNTVVGAIQPPTDRSGTWASDRHSR